MQLNFKRFGEGPPVVLLHGLFGSLENLGVLSRNLSQYFSVYALDLPEHGRSAHSDHTSIGKLSQQVKAWCDAQQLSDVALVGHSLGGKVSMELALSSPALVSRLAVLDIAPVKYSGHHTAIFKGLLALQPAELKSRSEAEHQLSEYVDEAAVRSFLLKNLEKRGGAYGWRMNLPVLHRDYHHLLESNRQARYPGPTLFLGGARSGYIAEQYHSEIFSRFPQADIEFVDDAGHWLHAEQPERVLSILYGFLNKQ